MLPVTFNSSQAQMPIIPARATAKEANLHFWQHDWYPRRELKRSIGTMIRSHQFRVRAEPRSLIWDAAIYPTSGYSSYMVVNTSDVTLTVRQMFL